MDFSHLHVNLKIFHTNVNHNWLLEFVGLDKGCAKFSTSLTLD